MTIDTGFFFSVQFLLSFSGSKLFSKFHDQLCAECSVWHNAAEIWGEMNPCSTSWQYTSYNWRLLSVPEVSVVQVSLAVIGQSTPILSSHWMTVVNRSFLFNPGAAWFCIIAHLISLLLIAWLSLYLSSFHHNHIHPHYIQSYSLLHSDTHTASIF